MPERVDFVALLREADARLADVAPSAHAEARLRAALRGEPAAETSVRRRGERRFRPLMTVVAVAAAGAIAIEGVTYQGPRSIEPSASAVELSDDADAGDDPGVAPDDSDPRSESGASCADGRSRPGCGRPSTTAAPSSSPRFEPRSLERRSPLSPADAPRTREEQGRLIAPERAREAGGPLRAPSSWSSAGAPAPTGLVEPRLTSPLVTYGAAPPLRAPHEDPSALSAREIVARFTGRGASAHSSSSKVEPPLWSTSLGEAPRDPTAGCKRPDEWKDIAYLSCKEQGLELVNWALLDECGDGRFASMDHECDNPANAPGSGSVCVGGALGDGSTCAPPDVWKLMAWEACSNEGGSLTDLSLSLDCDGGESSFAKYVCCRDVPSEPVPSQDGCVTSEIVVPCIAKDAFIDRANADCEDHGLVLAEISAVKSCGDGSVEYGSFLCCPAP